MNIRVRFAPSPTGSLHIGGVRTALFNYLFALKNHGKFILRIDDTDPARSKKEYEEAIIDDLKWFELSWEEFYRQSERKDLYEKALNTLKEKGLIFECYCSEEEILKSRELSIKSGRPYIYNGRCLKLGPDEKSTLTEKYRKMGIRPSIRLHTHGVGIRIAEFNDMVHGHISFNTDLIGDFILKTEKDRFTYNFASIIDDLEMGITHVIRGEDHLPNTPKQVLILKALGRDIPEFAHISLLYGKDGKIMSKRDDSSDISYYRKEGYLPGAILNYLAITGNTFIKKEIFSGIGEMAPIFDITRTKSSGAVFDEGKLKFINEKWLDSISPRDLFETIIKKFESSVLIEVEREYGTDGAVKILDFLKREVKTVSSLIEELKIFSGDFPRPEKTMENYHKLDNLRLALKKKLENTPPGIFADSGLRIGPWDYFNEIYLKRIIDETSRETSANPKECYETLRFYLTGKEDGPSILKIASLLGEKRVIGRLSLL